MKSGKEKLFLYRLNKEWTVLKTQVTCSKSHSTNDKFVIFQVLEKIPVLLLSWCKYLFNIFAAWKERQKLGVISFHSQGQVRGNEVIQLDFPGKTLFLIWIDSFSSTSVTQALQSVKTISHMTHPFHGLFPETLSVAQK